MALHLSRKQHRQLLDWARGAGDRECCGLLLGEMGIVSGLLLATNIADNPAQHFEVDPAVLIAAEKQARQGGPSIIGYFHSHPNGLQRPSEQDAASAATDGRIWVIISKGEVSAWLPKAGGMTAVEFGPVKIIVEG